MVTSELGNKDSNSSVTESGTISTSTVSATSAAAAATPIIITLNNDSNIIATTEILTTTSGAASAATTPNNSDDIVLSPTTSSSSLGNYSASTADIETTTNINGNQEQQELQHLQQQQQEQSLNATIAQQQNLFNKNNNNFNPINQTINNNNHITDSNSNSSYKDNNNISIYNLNNRKYKKMPTTTITTGGASGSGAGAASPPIAIPMTIITSSMDNSDEISMGPSSSTQQEHQEVIPLVATGGADVDDDSDNAGAVGGICTKSAVSQRNVDIRVDENRSKSIDTTTKQLTKKVLKLDLSGKDLDEFSVKSPKSPITARMPHQSSLTSSVDVEDRKTLREALYQGIFHRHRRTIFAVGSFLRMLRSRNSQYNTIRSNSEGDDIDEKQIVKSRKLLRLSSIFERRSDL